MYDRQTINELNTLSKEVFGTTSKWRKMIDKGVHTLREEDTVKVNPDGSKETVRTAALHMGNGGGELPVYYLNRYTVESVKEFMLSVLIQRQKYMEFLKKQEEVRSEASKAISQAQGSSV